MHTFYFSAYLNEFQLIYNWQNYHILIYLAWHTPISIRVPSKIMAQIKHGTDEKNEF